jgi:hypothetical protein
VSEERLIEARERGRQWLRTVRNRDGSWGYLAGEAGRAEPTVLALAAGPEPEWLAGAWLTSQEPSWPLLLLPALGWQRSQADCKAALTWMLATRSEPVPDMDGFDGGLPGWSWVAGTAGWVEPTAYALLSLRRAEPGAAAVAEAQALLVDRQCQDGGWNYGNPRVLGTELAGHLGPTGWAVMALEPGPAAERGMDFLQGALSEPSTLSLALLALCAARHGRDPGPAALLLADRVGTEGVRARTDLTALAVAALDVASGGAHAFV